jgi:hypothetical protein
MTSEAQRAANQRNAKKSTGPRTEDGKARSSANALRHGVYSTRHDSISASILEEDPDEVLSLLQDVYDELKPRTALEAVAVDTVATRVLNRVRVNRLTSPLASGAAPTDDDWYTVGTARNEVRVAREMLHAIDVMEERSDGPVGWMRLIFDVSRIVSPKIPFTPMQTWPNGELRPPETEDEWRFKFDDLVRTSFEDYDEARQFANAWIGRHAAEANAETRQEEANQARKLLEDFERIMRIADHVDRGFDRSMASFEKMRARTDREQGDPRNEPNP